MVVMVGMTVIVMSVVVLLFSLVVLDLMMMLMIGAIVMRSWVVRGKQS